MKRRIGAGTYLLSMSVAIIFWSVAITLICEKLVVPGYISPPLFKLSVSILGLVFAVFFYPMSAARLRDLNVPAWSVKFLSFPLIAVIILPLLCFLSGPRWENDYGPQSTPSGFFKITAAFVAFGIASCALYSALTTLHGTLYILLSQGIR